jgi:hypothetical protein
MKQRWALVVMGAWLMGTVWTSIVATENFYTIDRLLGSSPNSSFTIAVEQLGQPQARGLLRYLSSELNRLYFQMWNVAQLVLGVLALWLVVGSRQQAPGFARRAVRGVIAMLAIVVAMLVWLTPSIVTLGRGLDFVPRDPAPPGLQRFWVLHATYTSLEMLKLIVGAAVTWWIVSSSPAGAEADRVGHVTAAGTSRSGGDRADNRRPS